jgi:periplasmic mercuric ion binding protein
MSTTKTLFLFSLWAITAYSCGSGASKEESFYVRGNCGMCKDRIEESVKAMNGVYSAAYDVKNETLNVVYDTTLLTRLVIEKQCADLGHGTAIVPMNDQHHADLPECCQVTHNKGKH